MPAEIEGEVWSAARYKVGLWSLEHALSDLQLGQRGIPLRSIWEIFGPPESGKNTLAFYLAGHAFPRGRILYAALEGVDKEYVANAVGQGTVEFISHFLKDAQGNKVLDKEGNPMPRSHALILQEVGERFWEQGVTAAILDSVGRLRPPAEEKAEMGESFMGRRAQLLNQFLRAVEGPLMDRAWSGQVFILNHVNRGGIGMHLSPGVIVWTTPGGDGLKFSASVRLHVKPKEVIEEGVAYLSGGKVEKLRYGGKGRSFLFAIIAGMGVSRGLTAVYDASALGLADMGNFVKVNNKSIGRISQLVKAAIREDESKFEPLYEQLDLYEKAWVDDWQKQKDQALEMDQGEDPKPKASRSRKASSKRS